MIKEMLQDKKKMMVVAVVLLAVIGIIIWLRSRKSQESNYRQVMPRGFFPSTPMPTPTPPPPPEPTPTPTPPPGDSIMGMPPPAPTPPPINPAVPYPPYGYGYPGPMYYNPFPRTYIVDEARSNRSMNKGEYIQTLINAINVLEDRYDQAISDLTFGIAIRIANQIKGLRADLKTQLRYS